MHTSLAAQLTAAGLDGLSIKDSEATEPMPSDEALHHTVTAAWSEMFGIFAGTPLERPGEDLAWNFVNIFHRAAEKQERRVDEARDQIRLLIAEGDSSEIGSSNLEEMIARGQEAERNMEAFETMREQAAMLYCAETTHSWRPFRGGRNAPGVTSAIVERRAFLQARADTKRRQAMPAGTPIVFSGGRFTIPEADANTFADNLFRTLDRVRHRLASNVRFAC